MEIDGKKHMGNDKAGQNGQTKTNFKPVKVAPCL